MYAEQAVELGTVVVLYLLGVVADAITHTQAFQRASELSEESGDVVWGLCTCQKGGGEVPETMLSLISPARMNLL